MELRFHFDVVCPYAYLGSTRVVELAERAGAKLTFRPMLLGGVFRAIGAPDRPASALPPSKARMIPVDLARWARRFDVPLTMPPEHPRRSVDAMRLCAAATTISEERARAVAAALFRAYWIDNLDIARREVLDPIALAHDLDPAAIDHPDTKALLRALTDEAVAEGVFGAPAFVVVRDDGRRILFWGQDRMHFVEKALAGWEVP